MQRTTYVSVIMLILFVIPALSMPLAAQEPLIPPWKPTWKYRQEIILPISINNSAAYYQPVDMQITFDNPCWSVDVNDTSIRIVCWDGHEWDELESQIYNLIHTDSTHISSCSIVFLVPKDTKGNEHFFIYYDDQEKPQPEYVDHVSVEDAYYYYSPIAEVRTEAQFYAIRQHGFVIYGVGQEGQLLDRPFSQVVLKQKEAIRDFDAFDADLITSFAFSYYFGSDEQDESSSDQILLNKEIFVDGNLMVEFGISSESKKQDVKTIAIYKYYYCPSEEKRLSIRVRHELSDDVTVKGMENIDGRFGSIYSIQAKSQHIERLNTGKILPYLFLYGESNQVEEYRMNTNPETKEREWIISYEDDVDLGDESWFAYGDKESGKTHALIFHSNKNIVKKGTSERDGIQLKTTVREYIDFLGTEVDYASINFGRNSYEEGFIHDVHIPADLVVEFDAELFSKNTGGYPAVQREAAYYQELIKYRHIKGDESFESTTKTYDLTVHTHLGGTRFSYPILANLTNRNFPIIALDLYQNELLVASVTTNRSLFRRSYYTFENIPEGNYLLKVYWKRNKNSKQYTAYKQLSLQEDTSLHLFCTWERRFHLQFIDQYENPISGLTVFLIDDNEVKVSKGTTTTNGDLELAAPVRFMGSYRIQAYYQEKLVYDDEIKNRIRIINQQYMIPLYELTVEVRDILGFPPAVDINPKMTDFEEQELLTISPEQQNPGVYHFTNLPSGKYLIKISYANFQQQQEINIPLDKAINLRFNAHYTLQVELLDSQGHPLDINNYEVQIFRQNQPIRKVNIDEISLPPASYTFRVSDQKQIIGIKEIELTANRNIKLVTSITSVLPIMIFWLSIIGILASIILTYFKRLKLTTMLRVLIIAFILIALVQPWWSLSGTNSQVPAEHAIQIFIIPQIMIEAIEYAETPYYDISELPDIYISLLEQIYGILIIGCICIVLSIGFHIMKKQKYSLFLLILGILILLAVSTLFYIGTLSVTELSLGQLQGTGNLPITINQETLQMQSNWGLTTGWYLVVFAFFIGLITVVYQLRIQIRKIVMSSNFSRQ